MADEGSFKISGAYVEVNLKDDTEADYAKLKAKLQAEPPVQVGSKLETPDTRKPHDEAEAAARGNPVKIPAKVDGKSLASSATAAGSESGGLLAAALGLGLIAGGPLVGAAFVGIGVAGTTALAAYLEKGNPAVQAGWKKLSTDAKSAATDAAAGMVPPISDALGRIDRLVQAERPRLKSLFAGAGQDIAPLTDGIVGLANNALPGLDNAMRRSLPIAQGLADVERDIGTAVAAVGNAIAGSSSQIGSDLSSLGNTVTITGHALGDLLGIASQLGQGAIPVLNGALSTIEGTLHAVDSALGPIGPEVGALAAAGLIAVPVFKQLDSVADKLGGRLAGAGGLTGRINGLIQSTTGIAGGLGGLARGLPYVGVATAGLSALTGVLSEQQRKAAASTDKQAASSGDLNRALQGVQNATLGQINSAVLAHAQGTLNLATTNDQIFTNVKLGQVLSAAGISQQEFASALENGGGALSAVRGKLTGYIADVQKQYAATGDITDAQDANAAASDVLSHRLDQLHSSFLGSTAAGQLQNALMQQGAGFTKQLSQQLQQVGADEKVLADNSSNAGQRLQALLDEMHQLAEGGAESADDAIEGASKAVQQLGQQLSTTKGKLLDANGQFNLYTERGQAARDATKQVADQIATYAAALAKQGESTGQVTSKTAALVDRMAGPLAKALGTSTASARRYIETLLGTPKQVATNITTPGATIAFQNIGQVQRSLDKLPPHTAVTVTGITAAAESRLTALGFHVNHLPNGSVTVTATDHVTGTVNEIIRRNNGKVVHVRVDTGGGFISHATGGIDIPAPRAAMAFATGGLATATPMSSQIATVVPPNVPRIIGDNRQVPEAFAPLDGSQRTREILTAASRHEGLTGGPGTVVNNTFQITQQPNEDGYVLARRVSADTSWALMTSVGG